MIHGRWLGLAMTALVIAVMAAATEGRQGKDPVKKGDCDPPKKERQPGEPILPDAAFLQLVAADGKVLSEVLAGAKMDKAATRKAQTAALMIAAYGDYSGHADAAKARDNGEAAYQAIKAGDIRSARKAAEGIHPKLTVVKLEPRKPQKPDFRSYMGVFAVERLGGFGVEGQLDDLSEAKGKLNDTQFARAVEIAYKAALVGEVAEQFAPEKDEGTQTRKNWSTFAADFRKASLDLAAAAAAKNESKTRTALESLGKTCVQCHDVFR
jgi:hypothetical protein